RRRLSGDNADTVVFSAAHRQCAAVREALAELVRQGLTKLLPRQVEQLVAHAMPGGTTHPAAAAQVGCMRSASIAAACVEPADEVIWWMPSSPDLPSPLPWSPDEVRALAQIGVQLRDPARELISLAGHWLRPLLAARQSFILVCPPAGAEVHPIRQLLKRLIPAIEAGAVDLDAAIGSTLVGTASVELARQTLPSTPRFIQLP